METGDSWRGALSKLLLQIFSDYGYIMVLILLLLLVTLQKI